MCVKCYVSILSTHGAGPGYQFTIVRSTLGLVPIPRLDLPHGIGMWLIFSYLYKLSSSGVDISVAQLINERCVIEK